MKTTPNDPTDDLHQLGKTVGVPYNMAHLNKSERPPGAACPTLKSGTAFHNEAALGLQELKRRLN